MSVLASIGIKGKDGNYKNYTISISDFTNDFGQNVTMYEEQTKEERDNNSPKKYIGNGKVFWTDGKVQVAEKQVETTTSTQEDDLPF